jgi:uncharacterized membrane protein YfcA
MTVLVLASAAVLAGAVVRGFTGFGASMFWVASLSLVYAPSSVVPTVLALEVLASLVLLPAVHREIHWRSMRWLFLGTVLTMPLGVYLLSVVPERPMRLVVALVILAATLAVASGVHVGHRRGPGAAVGAGSVSGVFNGATGIGGPPVVLFYLSGTSSHEVGRATLVAYFLGVDAIGFAMMAGVGLVDSAVLVHTALFAPLALGGIALGQVAFQRSGGAGYRRVVIGVLLMLSVAMLVRTAAG